MDPKTKRTIVLIAAVGIEIGLSYAGYREAKRNHKDVGGQILYTVAGGLTGAYIATLLMRVTGTQWQKK